MGTQPILAIVGAGAAGYFAAIHAANVSEGRLHIMLLERSDKTLAKLRISGGGRCNVTHAAFTKESLLGGYPRGAKALPSIFARFDANDMLEWLDDEGVRTHTESDGRIFPITNSSETVARLLEEKADELGIELRKKCGITSFVKKEDKFLLHTSNGDTIVCDALVIATGGSPNLAGMSWLSALGHEVVPPVPSLFTFPLKEHPFQGLEGLSVPHAKLKLKGSKLFTEGPLLITHWGLSGPAALKLSAWGAREMANLKYDLSLIVSWLGEAEEDEIMEGLLEYKLTNARKHIKGYSPLEDIPTRLWDRLLTLSGVRENLLWADMSKKEAQALSSTLLGQTLHVFGKTTYKEEFVTAGGIPMNEVDTRTMESKIVPGLYFAGEVLDIDGVTGGFNFQAAWSTGFVAGRAAAQGLLASKRRVLTSA